MRNKEEVNIHITPAFIKVVYTLQCAGCVILLGTFSCFII